MNQYTNVSVLGDKILFRGIVNGKRRTEKFKFSPALFIPTTKESPYKTLQDQPLEKFDFETIKEAKDFVSRYKEVDNFKIYGNTSFEYVYIGEQYPNIIEWSRDHIRVANLDIETDSVNGYSTVTDVTEAITAITLKINAITYVFSCGEFIIPDHLEGIKYYNCRDEYDLIERFLDIWTIDYPDVITGWFVQFYDIPYLVNRITKLLGEDKAKKLSPWGHLFKRSVVLMGKSNEAYTINGIAILDYIELYRKFAKGGTSRENYRLNTICEIEIGEKKISYEEYGNLHNLYRENFQLFLEYNIRDVHLVDRLDNKLKLLDLAFTLAYQSKCNYGDIFTQTRMWDSIIYNWLNRKNVIVPPKSDKIKSEQFIGAAVKEPQLGKHKWVVSFDLTSLYPHIQMQYNLSPETLVEPCDYPLEIREMLQQGVSINSMLDEIVDLSTLKKHNLTISPNGQIFRKNIQGFLPEILEKMYADRARYKGLMQDAERELEKGKNNLSSKELEEIKNRIAKYDNLQANVKICANSCFGSQGNEFFRFYDTRQAEAITTHGQLVIRWIQKHLNIYLNTLLGSKDKDYIIASDTDSVYIVLDTLVDKVFKGQKEFDVQTTNKVVDFLDKACKTKIQPFIDQCYQRLADYTNAYAQKMSMKREKIIDIGIAVGAKNYIWNVWDSEGIRYSEPKLSIVGLAMIKSKTPEVARKELKKVIPYIIQDNEKELQKFMKEFRKKFFACDPEDVAVPTSMKGLMDYKGVGSELYKKGTPIHVRAAILYNHLLKEMKLTKKYPLIKDGEKIKYTYLKIPNPTRENVIGFTTILPKEFGLHEYVDYAIQYEKGGEAPLKAILDVIGWTIEGQSSLEDFWV